MQPMTFLPVTALFVAVFALLQVPMTVAVGPRRAKSGIQFMDGGDETLLKRMRAHGNFTETAPMSLLAMGAAELAGAPGVLLWSVGGALLVGRILHYGTLVTSGFGIGRAIGMILTLAPLLIFPGFVLAQLFRQ
ncbi:MAPEG family protein [Roseibium sp. FZY0029]|uniref:MAPEG family protein n=1 Tax=Roseibium sp. FZY0029 TaxID=3116647 RepID=UPI002EABF207|nr:MAPEG family protein [Roseibium sp. FZY0029]